LATRKASSKVGAPQLHENTPLHFRAAALPGCFGLLRHAFSYPEPNAKIEVASETNRAGEADAESGIPNAYRKAHPVPSDQTKVFPLSFRIVHSLFRLLSLCFPKTFSEIHPKTYTRP
jgi:hypothetical protein